MEVEFLSNMKYCLFTTAEDWTKWQTLLGKFANYFERASKPQPINPPAPILPPSSSFHLPMALPSPPASNQASPPYMADPVLNSSAYGNHYGPTPAPSPLSYLPISNNSQQNTKKRTHEDYATEPPAKRIASGFQNYQSPLSYANMAQGSQTQQQHQRAALPSLANSVTQSGSGVQPAGIPQGQQLPPLHMPQRAMAMVYPSASSQAPLHNIPAAAAGNTSQPPSQYQSRQQSPYAGSATASPSRNILPPTSQITLQPPIQVSPTYFLQQRNSPYRPVHHVSTLTYPPTTAALQNQTQSVEYNQMHYQPLGKPIQHAQPGRLPYVSQNVWLEGNGQQSMTPVFQWPGFMGNQRHQNVMSQ